MIAIEFSMVLKNPTNVREHWGTRAKRVRRQRSVTRLMLQAKRVEAHIAASEMAGGLASPTSLVVTLTRIAPRAMDDDGSIAALKHIRDEVAAYLGVDDADPRLEWRYGQAKGRPMVRIEFEVGHGNGLQASNVALGRMKSVKGRAARPNVVRNDLGAITARIACRCAAGPNPSRQRPHEGRGPWAVTGLEPQNGPAYRP